MQKTLVKKQESIKCPKTKNCHKKEITETLTKSNVWKYGGSVRRGQDLDGRGSMEGGGVFVGETVHYNQIPSKRSAQVVANTLLAWYQEEMYMCKI